MRIAVIAAGAGMLCCILAGASVAQTSTQPAPAATTAPSGGAKMDKTAISKACSQQADAKNLHGKARKEFRSKCKMKGGKMG